MKKTIKTIIAMTLLLIMATISPMNDLATSPGGVARAAEDDAAVSGGGAENADAKDTGAEKSGDAAATGGNQLYISEVKVGMGETEEEAKSELTAGGFIILTDDSGAPADLNKDAEAGTIYKDGPKTRVVYLGYKTTTDPNQAITDLATMNMQGGYSVNDYAMMMEQHKETQVKPFIDRFIATINEYRANLKKPEDSLNFKRADYFRQMLNKLIDDDTGKHVGDLLTKKTKYEMGDAEYNKLSDSEKKEHADIITLLLQGNGKAIALMEVLLSKATDTSDDTWLDRFLVSDLESLEEEVQIKKPSLTTKGDIDAELDKKYEDSAKQILDSWEDTRTLLEDPEEKLDDAVDSIEEHSDALEAMKDQVENAATTDSVKEYAETIVDLASNQIETTADAMNLRAGAVGIYLDGIDYQDGTLLDFFQRSTTDFSGNKIRDLYPLVASLTDGQIAGLEFLSVMDLISIAIQDEEAYKDEKIESYEDASVFEGVDREIYEPGGVAMTNEAMRAEATSDENYREENPAGVTSNLSIALYVGLGVSAVCTAISVVGLVKNFKAYSLVAPELKHAVGSATIRYNNAFFEYDMFMRESRKTAIYASEKMQSLSSKVTKTKEALDEANKNLKNAQGSTKTFAILTGVMVVITLAMTALTIWSTLSDYDAYYNVTFTPIPKFMVDEVDITAFNRKGERIVINNQTAYYRIVTCNRKEGSSDREKEIYEVLKDRSDLNGDIGKQWVALYSVKYRNSSPILADSLKFSADKLPDGYDTGIHAFGEKTPMNINKKTYLFAEKPPARYVCFKKADETIEELTADKNAATAGQNADAGQEPGAAGTIVAGSVGDEGGATGGSGDSTSAGITPAGVALGGGCGIVLGGVLGALIMYFSRKKKVTVEEDK